MAKSRSTKTKKSTPKRETKEREVVVDDYPSLNDKIYSEVFLWIILAVSVILFLSNFGIGGAVGGAISSFLFGIVGLLAYLFPVILLIGCFFAVSNRGNSLAIIKVIAGGVMVLSICTVLELLKRGSQTIGAIETFRSCYAEKNGGGLFGGFFAGLFVKGFGLIGAYVIAVVLLIICLILITERSAFRKMKESSRHVSMRTKLSMEEARERRRRDEKRESDAINYEHGRGVTLDTKLTDASVNAADHRSDNMSEVDIRKINPNATDVASIERVALSSGDEPSISIYDSNESTAPAPVENNVPEVTPEKAPRSARSRSRAAKKENVTEVTAEETLIPEINTYDNDNGDYHFPPIDLLKSASGTKKGNKESDLKDTADKLQQTLHNFGVNVTITDVSCGPSVTRYEIQPEQGVKVSKIVNLADDIKLNLAAADIRIEAPIPGKAAVGIEVPNKENTPVTLKELIASNEFKKCASKIAFSAGRDISGQIVISDIAKMPHVLIAGTTGSGKSVCINTIIMSILYRAKPSEVKMILIDPKVVELSIYNGIPHLLIPVVTDPKKAAGAINWAVKEMTDRYNKFADAGVRDMAGFNAKFPDQKMPQIVLVVDELADLMMVASKEVEQSICRLAQLARAAGIHLIIATQRPSVDVITGLIKANMPSRIAFAVSSGVDSRTILDMQGAEKLLGKGDMLYYPQGYTKPLRVQGAFVSDEEVTKVVDFIKANNGEVVHDESITEYVSQAGANAGNTSGSSGSVSISDEGPDDSLDSFFEAAGRLIIEQQKGSIGMLQRRFKIGFNRAARIMDQLEEAGVVGPEEGTKPRRVIMSMEQFEEMFQEGE